MAKKSKLLLALDAEKGRDIEAEKRKKQVKAAEKRKRQKEEQSEDQTPEHGVNGQRAKKVKLDLKPSTHILPADETDAVNQDIIPQPIENGDASASEAEESDVPLSELEDEDMEDTIPHQRLTINNGPALNASRKRVTIAKPKMPFHYHNSLVSQSTSENVDPNDDITRELEFYRIARDAVVSARVLLKKEKIPFTRPTDYFAEMVKSDEHMGKIKKKLYDEAAGKKASEEAKRLRDAKKFGKAVQIAKEQERAKEKRATLDNIKELKKKRRGQNTSATNEGDDLFQEISVDNDKRDRDRSGAGAGTRGRGRGDGRGAKMKRESRDSKFGFGGRKRFSKSGDAVSSSDLSSFSSRGMKGRSARGGKRPTTKRLGKSKRAARP